MRQYPSETTSITLPKKNLTISYGDSEATIAVTANNIVMSNDQTLRLPAGTLTITKGNTQTIGSANGMMGGDQTINLPSHELTIRQNGVQVDSVPGIVMDSDKTIDLTTPIWNGGIGHIYTASTEYELGENHTDTEGKSICDSRGFAKENGFLTYTAQTDCFLYVKGQDLSDHYGDGFSIFTYDGTNILGYRLFRHLEMFKGPEPESAFNLPVKQGTKIVFAFHFVKFQNRLEPPKTWSYDSPFVACDIDLSDRKTEDTPPAWKYSPPALDKPIENDIVNSKKYSYITDRTWDYVCTLAKRTHELDSSGTHEIIEWYPEDSGFTATEYKIQVYEMPFVG